MWTLSLDLLRFKAFELTDSHRLFCSPPVSLGMYLPALLMSFYFPVGHGEQDLGSLFTQSSKLNRKMYPTAYSKCLSSSMKLILALLLVLLDFL